MNPLDYVLLALLLAFFLYGYFRGFARQVLLFVGIGGSFFLASKYHSDLAGSSFFENMRERSESVALVIAFSVIFFVSAGVVGVLATFVGRRIQSWQIGSADRWLGGLLGVLVGVLPLGALCLALKEWQFPHGAVGNLVTAETEERTQGLVIESFLVPQLADLSLDLVALIPQEGREELSRAYEENLEIFRRPPGKQESGGSPSTPFDAMTTSRQATPDEAQHGAFTRRRLLDLGARHRIAGKQAERANL